MPITINGSTSGGITLAAPAVAGTNTATLPAATGNIVLDSATQTLTNKTLGTGCVLGTSLLTPATSQNANTLTAIDFTGIPSWVKRITIMISGITGGAQNVGIRLGTGATPTYVTSGYVSAATAGGGAFTATTYLTAAFRATPNVSDAWHGSCVLTNLSGNVWSQTGNLSSLNVGSCCATGGSVDIGAQLTAVRIAYANFSTTAFTGGSVNIMYE